MASSHVRDVMVTAEFKEQVENLMWSKRTSLSALIREAVAQFAEHGLAGIDNPVDPGAGPEALRFAISPELWKAAEDKTWEIRVKRPDGIRIILQHMVTGAVKPRTTRKKATPK
jgi:hypothetical protein